VGSKYFHFTVFGVFVVVADVAHEFSLQVWHRGEHAASDDVALDLGEPQLDLVEPGGVGRSEVQVNLRMSSRNSLTCPVLWAERLSAITWISLPRGWLTTMSVRKATNSAEVWRAAVLPNTSPVLVLNAA
jgi:hypothetical protein